MRVLVVGAGPSGVAAALGAAHRGHDVRVLEADAIGGSLRRWGPTRFFSPVAMNVSALGARVLGDAMPPGDALLTGTGFAERVLEPLCASSLLAGRVHVGHRVVAIGRSGMLRGDFPNHPVRAERSFRVLVEGPEGERALEADAVLDATGTYGQPVWLGPAGLPALGERALSDRIVRDLGALHALRSELAGRRVLLVGHGHSAAHGIAVLEVLSADHPDTRVTWAVRVANTRPCTDVAGDPLPERHAVVARANALAMRPPPWLTVERRAVVEGLASDGEGGIHASLSGGRRVACDVVVALTGFRPDLGPLSELALEISPVTEGSARLAAALAGVTDCLSVPQVRPEDLGSGEPRFHLIGAKSYGRSRTFLLQTGYAQIESVLDALTG